MNAIIFDIDGTLADVRHRLHHLDGEKNWHAFFNDMGDDPVIEPVATLARHIATTRHKSGIEAVLVVSARPASAAWGKITKAWLERHGIVYDRLYMRAEDDRRPDQVVKSEILQRILDDGYSPVLVVDDRPQVVAMWRDHGIVTLQCAPSEKPASPYAGKTLLHMLIGPSGAGKSTYAAANYEPHNIVSTDAVRLELYGNLGHSPKTLARVWRYVHGMIRARLENGIITVLDATNLDANDRARVLENVPEGVFTRYIVIDRPYDERLKQADWRSEDLIAKTDRIYRRNLKEILAGDGHPYVTVKDARKR